MQTYTQSFGSAQTWRLDVPGRYFIIMAAAFAVNVRFFKGGRKLDLGDITNVLPGLEVGPLPDVKGDGIAFDRVEIDILVADTVQVGVGNGLVRYNRAQGSVLVTNPLANPLQVQDSGIGYGVAYVASSNLAAVTPTTILAAGGNANGVLVVAASLFSAAATLQYSTFLAKATAPANSVDGDPLLSWVCATGGANQSPQQLQRALRVAAGKGLHFISQIADVNTIRSALYTVL